MSCFPHGDPKMYPQGQGFRILPSLWGHFTSFVGTFYLHDRIPEPHTQTHTELRIQTLFYSY